MERTAGHPVSHCPLPSPLRGNGGHGRSYAAQTGNDGTLVQIHDQNFGLIGEEEEVLSCPGQAFGRDKHGQTADMTVAKGGAEVGERVGPCGSVPDAHASVVAGRDDICAIVRPSEAVHGAGVRLGGHANASADAEFCSGGLGAVGKGHTAGVEDTETVFLVKESDKGVGSPNVPNSHRAVDGATGEDMFVDGRPSNSKGSA